MERNLEDMVYKLNTIESRRKFLYGRLCELKSASSHQDEINLMNIKSRTSIQTSTNVRSQPTLSVSSAINVTNFKSATSVTESQRKPSNIFKHGVASSCQDMSKPHSITKTAIVNEKQTRFSKKDVLKPNQTDSNQSMRTIQCSDKTEQSCAESKQSLNANKDLPKELNVLKPILDRSKSSCTTLEEGCNALKQEYKASKQTYNASNQTCSLSKQTCSVSKQMCDVSKQTCSTSKQSFDSSKQTFSTSSTSKQTSSISKQISSTSKQTSSVSKQTPSTSKQTSSVPKQTSSTSKQRQIVSIDKLGKKTVLKTKGTKSIDSMNSRMLTKSHIDIKTNMDASKTSLRESKASLSTRQRKKHPVHNAMVEERLKAFGGLVKSIDNFTKNNTSSAKFMKRLHQHNDTFGSLDSTLASAQKSLELLKV